MVSSFTASAMLPWVFPYSAIVEKLGFFVPDGEAVSGMRSSWVLSAHSGQLVVLVILLTAGNIVVATQPPSERLAVLSEYVSNNDIEEIQELIAEGADVNLFNKFHVTPINMAAERGQTEVVQAFIAAGADIHLTYTSDDPIVSRTPLFSAANRGHEEIVRVLLKAGADPNATEGALGRTPLHQAACDGRLEIVKLLVDAKANLNMKDNDNCTALNLAFKNNHVEVINILNESGAGVGRR